MLNVNKGKGDRDVVENYVIRYNAASESFVFYNKSYKSLSEFASDPLYTNVLKYGKCVFCSKFCVHMCRSRISLSLSHLTHLTPHTAGFVSKG